MSLADVWFKRWWKPDAAKLAAFDGLQPFVVITGGSDGIGRALTERFAKAGHDVMLIARRREPLEAAATTIMKSHGVKAIAVPLDLTAPDALAAIVRALAAHGAYCDILINNAGIGLAGDFLTHTEAEVAHLIALNVSALTALTHHMLAEMQVRGRGGVLNIASLGGFAPGPSQAAYYASKAYVVSLTEALAHELRGQGVRIAVVAPGPVDTDFHSRIGSDSGLYRVLLPQNSPASIARSAYRGFRLRRRVIVPGVVHSALGFCMRLLPNRIVVPIIGWLLQPRLRPRAEQGSEGRGNVRR